MTTPLMPPVPYLWIDTDDVVRWLGLYNPDVATRDLVTWGAISAQGWTERCRPDGFDYTVPTAPVCTDSEVYVAAVMLAGRIYRRRMSAAGNETFAESISFVVNADPDMQRMLHTGPYAIPAVG